LLKVEPYEHKYPYDWRTKKPTIFRATSQWFASIDAFKDEALSEIEKVNWVPGTGQNRITAFTSSRSEWCISRQRTWGVPIPVFYNKETGDPLLTPETVKHVQDVFSKHGSDAWFTMEVADLLPEDLRGEADKYDKGRDTMDVWFDSGTSWAGVVNERERLTYPADLYLEGSDQHRGWFQSSLLTSVASTGQAPYKAVLTHGFVMDEKGRKMSKSIGNVVLPTQVIDGGKNKKQQPPYGADVLRMWVASVDYTSDVSIGDQIIKQSFDQLRKIRNTVRYFIGNLNDFDAATTDVTYEDLPQIDRYILNKLQMTIDEADAAYKVYQFKDVVQAVMQFVTSDVSNFYLESAKDRLYTAGKSEPRRKTCQFTIDLILKSLAVILAPVVPHFAEDVFLNLPQKPAGIESIFQMPWPKLDTSKLTTTVPMDGWTQLLRLKDDINRALEKARTGKAIGASLDSKVTIVLPKDAGEFSALASSLPGMASADILTDRLSSVFVTSQCEVVEGDESALEGHEYITGFEEGETPFGIIAKKADFVKCVRCWHFSDTVGQDKRFPGVCEKCVEALVADKFELDLAVAAE